MSSFDWGGIIGAGLGIGGGLLSGNATDRSGRQQRNAQRTEDSGARSRGYGLFNMFTGQGEQDLDPYSKSLIADIDAQLKRAGTGTSEWSKLVNRRNEILTRGLGANGPQTPGITGMQGALDTERDRQLGEFDKTRGMADAYGPAARQSLESTYRPLMDLAGGLNFDNWGAEAKGAADAAYNQAITRGNASISSSLASRGMGGSTLKENSMARLQGEGAAGLAQAYAGIAGKQADLKLAAGMQRAGIMGDVANRMSGFDLSELARKRGSDADRFGLGQQFGNRRLGYGEQQNNAFLGLLGANQPTQLAPSSYNAGQQNVGNALGAFGGNLLGGWLQQQYYPQQQNRGGGIGQAGSNYLADLYNR